MPKIKVLPKEIAELIAAGEVVERPASVIKELMENAIDAGSSSVTVEIKNGGITYIRVTDNRLPVFLSYLPAFLSKIGKNADLNPLSKKPVPQGFSGEKA